jgi:hypothetical protein
LVDFAGEKEDGVGGVDGAGEEWSDAGGEKMQAEKAGERIGGVAMSEGDCM